MSNTSCLLLHDLLHWTDKKVIHKWTATNISEVNGSSKTYPLLNHTISHRLQVCTPITMHKRIKFGLLAVALGSWLLYIVQNKFQIYISSVTLIDVWIIVWQQPQGVGKDISIRETLQKQELQIRLQCLKKRVTNIQSLFSSLKNYVFHDLYPL